MLINILWQHPLGDTVKVPCRHLELVQTDTRQIAAPTGITLVAQHDHDTVGPANTQVPCIHLQPNVTWGTMDIPVYQLQPQHPDGDDSPIPAPCIHLLQPVRRDSNRNVIYYTDDNQYQDIATELMDRLANLDVHSLGLPSRPLLFFFREPANGYPTTESDPFWSQYEPTLHAIQVIRDQTVDYVDLRYVLAHELGHAIIGQSCVKVPVGPSLNLATSDFTPATALSEGWAEFVASVLSRADNTTPAPSVRNQFIYERRDPNLPPGTDITYDITCLLWDLYDIASHRRVRLPNGSMAEMAIPDDDSANTPQTAFTFGELFGVFSPSRQTLQMGPVIRDINGYLNRLQANHPERAAVVDAVRAIHLA